MFACGRQAEVTSAVPVARVECAGVCSPEERSELCVNDDCVGQCADQGTVIALEREVAVERRHIRNISLIAAVLILIVILVIIVLARNVRIGMKHRRLFKELKEERARLIKLLTRSSGMKEESRRLIIDRLGMLNDFFRSYMTQTTDKSIENTKKFISDIPAFMTSMRRTFEVTHPNFIRHLEDKGLTDEEIECCCLYAIGLSGKEIAGYMKRSGHYKESSRIRAKLGLEEHDTNLSNYIHALLQNEKTQG
ncbi:MAG: hypothetical protein LUE27_03000 [Clostridia bacterium]|nr:hypothetical protein [Clostridia bacterium]